MKTFFPILAALVLQPACNKEKLVDACALENPAESAAWVRQKVAELRKSPYCHAITRYGYRGQTVFVVGTCEPNANSVDQVYDCEGNLVCGWGDGQCPDFGQQAKSEKLIWESNQSGW